MTIGSTNSITAHTDWYATIYVTTTAGTSVTCNGITKEATTGYVSFTVYKAGSYAITGTLNGHTQTIYSYVYSATSYYETLYMTATIRVNAPVNAVVTVDGQSQTVTGTYVDFTVYSTGTYTVTGVLNGITTTNTVYVSSMGQTYSTTLVFGCYINIYSNIGTDVIYNGLRQTVCDTGYIRYWISGNGTYRFLCIYKGSVKEKTIVVTSTISDIDENIYFVPSEYQQVEYLQSSGTQYINTGLSLPNGFHIKGIMTITTSSQNQGVIGAMGSSPNYYRNFFNIGSTNQFLIGYGGTGYQYFGTSASDIEYKFDIANLNNNEHLKINGTSYTVSPTGTKGTFSSLPVYLLATNVNGTPSYYASCKLKYLIVNNINSVQMVFLPCKRVSDDELGLYDVITGTFHTNAGTGTFTAGSVISELPIEYQEVEYIKSNGTQYFDTGFTPDLSKTLRVEGKVGFVTTNRGMLMSAYGSDATENMSIELFTDKRFRIYTRDDKLMLTVNVNLNTLFDYYVNYSPSNGLYTGQANGVSFTSGAVASYLRRLNTKTLIFGSDQMQRFPYGMYGRTKIWNNGTLVRDFVPCYRKSDNESGMYDLVNGVFYSSEGTDSFLVGGNVNVNASLPSEYNYVEYTASTSDKTQYLNLGETGTNTTGMLLKMQYLFGDTSFDSIALGARATVNGRYSIGGGQNLTTSPQQLAFAYYGWNTLNRLTDYSQFYTTRIDPRILRTYSINYLNNRQECYDNTKAFDINQTLVQNTPNIYAFCEDNAGSALYNTWARIDYIVLTSGTSISNIFVPCYRTSDSVLGMYDIVKGNFNTNAGSGTFVDGGYLPSTYQQVEYIQSDGNQYINTGIIPQDNMIIDIKFNFSGGWLFAAAPGDRGSGGLTTVIYIQMNRIVCGSVGEDYIGFSSNISENTDTELKINTGTTNGTISVSGSRTGSATRTVGLTEYPITLFGRYVSSAKALATMKLYRFSVQSQNNNYNFVPCYRKSDSVAGMYDTENMVFYPNNGTGTFTVGPDVN